MHRLLLLRPQRLIRRTCYWRKAVPGVAMRAAYAWAYGFATTSGNREWLRNKIEEAVCDGGEIEDE